MNDVDVPPPQGFFSMNPVIVSTLINPRSVFNINHRDANDVPPEDQPDQDVEDAMVKLGVSKTTDKKLQPPITPGELLEEEHPFFRNIYGTRFRNEKKIEEAASLWGRLRLSAPWLDGRHTYGMFSQVGRGTQCSPGWTTAGIPVWDVLAGGTRERVSFVVKTLL